MSRSFASGTTVASEKSRMEIEIALKRAGADQFGYMADSSAAFLAFRIRNRAVRMTLPLPRNEELRLDGRKHVRSPRELQAAIEAETRRRWRCLGLVIKAKLTAVADGISTVEREFFPDVVLADGRTIGEAMRPAIEASKGGSPLLLPASLDGGPPRN